MSAPESMAAPWSVAIAARDRLCLFMGLPFHRFPSGGAALNPGSSLGSRRFHNPSFPRRSRRAGRLGSGTGRVPVARPVLVPGTARRLRSGSKPARIRKTKRKDRLPEVLVLGDEDATFPVRDVERRLVRGIGKSVAGRKDVVPESGQRVAQDARRDADIKEELHEASRTKMRSCTCSPARERWANTRHA